MEIDASGTVCPQPVLIVRRCLAELEAGETLTVTGDYPPAERSIRRACYKHGYAVTERESTDSEETFTLRIRVTETAVSGRAAPE